MRPLPKVITFRFRIWFMIRCTYPLTECRSSGCLAYSVCLISVFEPKINIVW